MEYIREANMEVTVGIDMDDIKRACDRNEILCAKALIYEKNTGLHFNLGGYKAIMPADEVAFSPGNLPVKEAAVVTRVNKNVCFVITGIDYSLMEPVVYLSRRLVQEKVYKEYVSKLTPGDVIPCTVTHVDSFGVFCDIGCGITALLPIDFISVSRINSPADRFENSQDIYACIKNIDDSGRIVLTHKELLGTWLENARLFRPHTSAIGVVRSVESYGIFIELAPNLAGLAECCEGIQPGDVVNVYIKSILPEKMKVKLVIMSKLKNFEIDRNIYYFITQGHIQRWRYSTDSGIKNIYTIFE